MTLPLLVELTDHTVSQSSLPDLEHRTSFNSLNRVRFFAIFLLWLQVVWARSISFLTLFPSYVLAGSSSLALGCRAKCWPSDGFLQLVQYMANLVPPACHGLFDFAAPQLGVRSEGLTVWKCYRKVSNSLNAALTLNVVKPIQLNIVYLPPLSTFLYIISSNQQEYLFTHYKTRTLGQIYKV